MDWTCTAARERDIKSVTVLVWLGDPKMTFYSWFIIKDLAFLFLISLYCCWSGWLVLPWFCFVLVLPIKPKGYCACMHVGQGWKLKQNMSIILCTITRGVILFSLRLQSHMLMSNISPTSALCDGKSQTKDFIKAMNRLQEFTTPWCGRSIPATSGA